MKVTLLIQVFLLTVPLLMFSQYTDVINSNRPGASHSAFAVGKNVAQIETGFGFNSYKHSSFLDSEVTNFEWQYMFRYGVWREQLELLWEGSYVRDQLIDKTLQPERTTNNNGFSRNYIGAKYLIYDPFKKGVDKPSLYSWRANTKFKWKDLIPAVSVFAGANWNISDNVYPYRNPFSSITIIGLLSVPDEPAISWRLMAATQSHIAGNWVLVTNLIYDLIGSDFPEFSYIITLTHSFDARWSLFIENQGVDSDIYSDVLFRGGGAYLITRNLQLDASIGASIKDTPSRILGSLGVSWRLDFHEDEIIMSPATDDK